MGDEFQTPEWAADISCEKCVAACCRAPIYMNMTKQEYEQHSKTMDLEIVAKPREYAQRAAYEDAPGRFIQIPPGIGLYELRSGCANLTEDHRCSIYTKRPRCCRDLELRSYDCLAARRKAGLDADMPPLPDVLPRGVKSETREGDTTERIVKQFFPTLLVEPETAHRGTTAPAPREAYDLAAVRALVARHTSWIGAHLSMCEPSAWSRRTRCAEWDVGELAKHLVTVQEFGRELLTAAIDGRVAETPVDYEGSHDASVDAFHTAARDVVELLGRISPAMVTREIVIDGVEAVTLENFLAVLSSEVAIHGLDLADALGEERNLTTDEVALLGRSLPEILDPGGNPRPGTSYVLSSVAFEVSFTFRNNAWRDEPGKDACRIEGDPEAVLLFAMGRVPWSQAGLTTNRADRARAFKRHLRGP